MHPEHVRNTAAAVIERVRRSRAAPSNPICGAAVLPYVVVGAAVLALAMAAGAARSAERTPLKTLKAQWEAAWLACTRSDPRKEDEPSCDRQIVLEAQLEAHGQFLGERRNTTGAREPSWRSCWPPKDAQ
jgi:hypothetical protein